MLLSVNEQRVREICIWQFANSLLLSCALLIKNRDVVSLSNLFFSSNCVVQITDSFFVGTLYRLTRVEMRFIHHVWVDAYSCVYNS